MPACILSRPIELYRHFEDRTWDTVIVDIPATTHESKIVEVAFAAADKKFGRVPAATSTDSAVCGWAIYNTYDDEVPEVPGAFIIEVHDDAVGVQRFLVTGCADEEEALEKMGNEDREEYGPDDIKIWIGNDSGEYGVRPFSI